jgi:hypothetical protein
MQDSIKSADGYFSIDVALSKMQIIMFIILLKIKTRHKRYFLLKYRPIEMYAQRDTL